MPVFAAANMPDMECAEACPSRKILKPVVEKQRRDRINRSLDEMRDLLLKLTANQKLRNPKMEKAEILELAVIYVRDITRMKSQDPHRWAKPAGKCYLSGFQDCLDRTEDFIQDKSPKAKARFLDELQTHLQDRLRLPNQLNLCSQVGSQDKDLSLEGNVSPVSTIEVSPCSPPLSGSESVSPPRWMQSSSPNPGAYQMEHNHASTYVWRPWP